MTSPVSDRPAAEDDRFHQIPQLLFGVTEQVRSAFESACAEFELTPPQARAVLALEHPRPMRWLAEILNCDASNVTGIADRLEARGLVLRHPADNDRRVKLLELTRRGKTVRRRIRSLIESRSPVMASLTDEERESLRALLAKMVGSPNEDAAFPRRAD